MLLPVLKLSLGAGTLLSSDRLECCRSHDLEAIAQHMRYRQRLQDKREARDRSLIADIQKSVPSLDGFSARRIIEAVREHDAKEAK